VIVFDAGTNDNPAYPQILAENLQKVTEVIGNRCMVVPTIHGFTVNGIDNSGKNEVVAAFAASRPGTQTPNWARIAETRPDLMADELHPTEAGADLRARLIARGVKACLGIAAVRQRKPALESGPELPPARKLARREAELLDSIVARLLTLLPIPIPGDA